MTPFKVCKILGALMCNSLITLKSFWQAKNHFEITFGSPKSLSNFFLRPGSLGNRIFGTRPRTLGSQAFSLFEIACRVLVCFCSDAFPNHQYACACNNQRSTDGWLKRTKVDGQKAVVCAALTTVALRHSGSGARRIQGPARSQRDSFLPSYSRSYGCRT